MSVMIAFGLVSIMICLGMFLRAKVRFLRNMLVPVTVIAGVIGLIFMNVIYGKIKIGVDANLYTDIVISCLRFHLSQLDLHNHPRIRIKMKMVSLRQQKTLPVAASEWELYGAFCMDLQRQSEQQ